MSILSPIWFFALAALSIPVLIHLWNIRPGKTLKVGSITLITEASKNTSRSFKLLDLLLLLLRCSLLALISLFLASPVWLKRPEKDKATGWVLIPKENFKESYQKFKPKVDSLIKGGFELHYFDKGFTKVDTTKLTAESTSKDTVPIANYWSLIKRLDAKLSGALPVYVVTPNGLNYFNGENPSVDLNLKWQTYTATDSTSKWIAGAWFTNNNAIKVTIGSSSPLGTYFTTEYLQNDGDAKIAVNVQDGRPFVNLKASNEAPTPVDTATLRVAIYTDKYALDAGYLNAALQAVIKFGGRKATIRQYLDPAQIPAGQSWLFWLSDEPVNSRFAGRAKQIFKYEPGKAAAVSSWVNGGDKYALPNNDQQITLFKLVSASNNLAPVWQDGYGRPILGLEKQDVNIYHFYTHFNPAWNDLVWSDDFPKLMLKLINGDTREIPAKYDKRILSDQQLQPGIIKETKQIAAIKPVEQTSLSRYFWLLIVVVFIAERCLAHQTKTQTND